MPLLKERPEHRLFERTTPPPPCLSLGLLNPGKGRGGKKRGEIQRRREHTNSDPQRLNSIFRTDRQKRGGRRRREEKDVGRVGHEFRM